VTRSLRWAIVVTASVALAVTPLVVRVLPVPGGREDTSAAALLARMRSSWSHPYAGYAESTGSLALPVSDQFDAVATLLGGRTQLRVWWRAADDWRADTLSPTGEHSTRASPQGVSVWDFEENRVTLTVAGRPGEVRLPQDADVLPPQLAARLLADADPAEVTGLPARRVAGRAADGLRLRPSAPLSSIGRVDVWADRASGIPVLVEVFGRTAGVAALSSTFLDFTPTTPSARDTQFQPPPGSRLRTGTRFDVVGIVRQFSPANPPDELLGLSRTASPAGLDALGQYGRGVTQVVVAALPAGLAGSLRGQLRVAVGVSTLSEGLAVSVGPVALLLTDRGATGQDWLVTGTVTPEGLARAATELASSSGDAR
jgi:hypothetical protein